MRRARALMVLIIVVALGCATTAVAAQIRGTDGPDVLVGTPSKDHIDGKGGNDVIFGLGGSDRIKGGWGDDMIAGDGECPPGATDPSYCETGGKCPSAGKHGDHRKGHHGHRPDGCDDHIDAGPGRDHVDAGPGDDWIDVRDGEVDTVDCGPGYDHVIADRGDLIAGNCEKVDIPRHGWHD